MEPARVVYLLRQVCHSLGEAHSPGLDSSRHQAGQHLHVPPGPRRRLRQGAGLRSGQALRGRRARHDADPRRASRRALPVYMAPEIALGKPRRRRPRRPLLARLRGLLPAHGAAVFSGETPVATVLAHVQDAAGTRRAPGRVPDSARARRASILECLAKEPSGRPASASELDRRLAECVPADAWTAEAARAWWDLRRIAVNPSRAGREPVRLRLVSARRPRRALLAKVRCQAWSRVAELAARIATVPYETELRPAHAGQPSGDAVALVAVLPPDCPASARRTCSSGRSRCLPTSGPERASARCCWR